MSPRFDYVLPKQNKPMHWHHNRGTERMACLIFQDEALHYYTRTPGFSFD